MDTLVIGDGSSSSDIIAIAALFVSIVSIVTAILLNRRQEKRSYMDEYWFREIFAPSCVDPVITFRSDWEKRLVVLGASTVTVKKGREIVSAISADAAELLQKIWVAKLFKGDFYEFCEAQLEKVEDDFAQILGASQLRTGATSGASARILRDHVTEVCAVILQRAASIHSEGLKISQ